MLLCLKELILSFCAIDDSAFISLSNLSLASLRFLDLTACVVLTDLAIEIPHLNHLVLSKCFLLTDFAMIQLVSYCYCNKIQHIDLSFCVEM
jgi:Leucine Rich Repeat (LRR) protein